MSEDYPGYGSPAVAADIDGVNAGQFVSSTAEETGLTPGWGAGIFRRSRCDARIMMRRNRVFSSGMLVVSIAGTLSSVGCATMSNAEKGAAVGGGIGTAAGAGLGAIAHAPVAGALVGGITGAAIGGLTGAEKDDRQERAQNIQQAQAVATQAQARMLTVPDVVHLAQQGHAEQVIINQIRATGSSFQLTSGDLDYLKANGVTDRVIAEMQVARPAHPATVVVPQPGPTVVYERPYYVRPYYAPPPPAIIIGPRPYWGPRHCW